MPPRAGNSAEESAKLDFGTGKPSQRRYSRAKVIDMIFFIEGGRLRTSPES